MKVLKFLALSLILAGCAQQSAHDSRSDKLTWYADSESFYRDMVNKKLGPKLTRAGMPADLQGDLIDCSWQALTHNLTAQQQSELDAAARGEKDISPSLGKEIVEYAHASFGKTGDFSAMEPYCHDKIAEFKKYVQQ